MKARSIRDWYRAWWDGRLEYLLRPDGQRRLYRFVEERAGGAPAPIVAECHRRLGKSFLGLVRAVECCLKAPARVAKIGAPTIKMAADIIEQNMGDLFEECPNEFKPRRSGDKWYWRNPRWGKDARESVLQIVGCDYKKGNLMRGTSVDMVFLDEAGYIEHLEYIRRSVIAPQFDKAEEPEFLIFSTPPEEMSHPFTAPGGVVEEAIRKGRHIIIRGSDNEDFDEREEQRFLEAAGVDKGSIEYLREIECQHISDERKMVVPEFLAARDRVLERLQRPSHFYPWVVMDTAWSDYTAVLFAYVDFERQKLCIEDEIWMHYRTLGEIADAVKAKEWELYADCAPLDGVPAIDSVRHLADCTELEIQSLARDHGLFFRPVEKYDKFSAIAALRTAIQRDRIRIDPRRAPSLVYQLENAVWNEARTDFKRTKKMGHCDSLMAAVYLNRMVTMDENPFPNPLYVPAREFRVEEPEDWEGLGRIIGRREP